MKMMSPNSRIDWIPEAGMVNPEAPLAATLNGGTNISAAIVTGFTLGATDSATDTSKTIVDEGNVETPTLAAYQGNLSFFRDDIGTGTQGAPLPATVFTDAYDLFKVAKVTGWLVSRHGKKANVDYAAGDVVSLYKFTSDYPREVDGEPGNPQQFGVEFLQQGELYLNVTVAAAV